MENGVRLRSARRQRSADFTRAQGAPDENFIILPVLTCSRPDPEAIAAHPSVAQVKETQRTEGRGRASVTQKRQVTPSL